MFEIKNMKGYGRGLVSSMLIKKGTIIEKAPALIFNQNESDLFSYTSVSNYVFNWDEKRSAIALGKCSLLNHDNDSNVEAIIDDEKDLIIFITTKDIKKGDQLFLDYGYNIIDSLKSFEKNKKKIDMMNDILNQIVE